MFRTSTLTQTSNCNRCPLKSRQLCRAVLGSSCPQGPRTRSVRAETRLCEENERPRFAGILRKGYLRTERIFPDGRRSVLGFFAPGDLIGDFLGSVRGPALVSATDAEFCTFDPPVLRRAMQEDTTLNMRFLREAVKLHTRQLEMVWRRGALNSRERIIAFMVMAAEFMPTENLPDGSVILTIKVTRKDWADFSNTTVETICRTLAYLAEKDMVETVAPARYRIRDLDTLAHLAGLDSVGDRSAMLVEAAPDSPEPVEKLLAIGTRRKAPRPVAVGVLPKG